MPRYTPLEKEIFHVHTKRCKHASDETDSEYVEKAIALGAERIVFTDHVPFPDDPFPCRMDYSELNEYLSSINNLKSIYDGRIDILCGFEVEFLPDYLGYFKELRASEKIDLLIIGQHFFQHSPGCYSLCDTDKTFEYRGQCEAMAQGIESGLFDVVAHPDRSFRKTKIFGEKENEAASLVINAALNRTDFIPFFEKNLSSVMYYDMYREDFWKLVPNDISVITGYDAHATSTLKEGWEYVSTLKKGNPDNE